MQRQLRPSIKGLPENLSGLRDLTGLKLRGVSLQILRIVINGVIVGLWLWLYRPLFDYFAVIFSREDFRTNQLVFMGVSVLIALQLRQERLRLRLDGAPHLYLPALGLVLGGSALYLF